MIDLDLDAIEARTNAATDGPWAIAAWDSKLILPQEWADEVKPPDARSPFTAFHATNEVDAEFIAHARTDVPALCAEVRWLQKELRLERFGSITDHARSNR